MNKNKLLINILCASIGGLLHAVGEKSTNTSGRDEGSRYNVIFEGVLTTQEGHVYKVNEITFNKLIKQVPVFEMPSKESYDIIDEHVHILKKNPNERLDITKLDLSEISMIRIPNPDSMWYYKKAQTADECTVSCNARYKISEDPRALKFIQIEVTDKAQNKDQYLVEAQKKIYCSEITASGPKEKDVQLQAIKTLTITGYRKRDETKDKEKKENVPAKPYNAQALKEPSLKTSSHSKRTRSSKIVRIS
jgi:hypothetical protein